MTKRLLKQNGAGVEAFFKKHGGVAGDRIAYGHSPLDGRCAAYLGSKEACRLMQPSRGSASIQGGMRRP